MLENFRSLRKLSVASSLESYPEAKTFLTTKRTKATKVSEYFRAIKLRTTIVQNLRETRKFSGTLAVRTKGISAPSTPSAQSSPGFWPQGNLNS